MYVSMYVCMYVYTEKGQEKSPGSATITNPIRHHFQMQFAHKHSQVATHLGIPASPHVIVKILVSSAMRLLENVLCPVVVTRGWDQAVNTVIFLLSSYYMVYMV